MKQFDVSFRCTERQLGDIVSLLSKEVEDLKVNPAACKPQRLNGQTVITRHRSTMPVQDSRIGRLIMQALATDIVPISVLKEWVATHGYKTTSASPTLTRLKDAGLVKQTGPGMWAKV